MVRKCPEGADGGTGIAKGQISPDALQHVGVIAGKLGLPRRLVPRRRSRAPAVAGQPPVAGLAGDDAEGSTHGIDDYLDIKILAMALD